MALHTHTPEERRRLMPKLRKKKRIQSVDFDMSFVGRSARGQTHNSAHKEEKQSGHKKKKPVAKAKTTKRKAPVSVAKAKLILREGEIRGRPLTEKQKKFFGFLAGGGKPTRASAHEEEKTKKKKKKKNK